MKDFSASDGEVWAKSGKWWAEDLLEKIEMCEVLIRHKLVLLVVNVELLHQNVTEMLNSS